MALAVVMEPPPSIELQGVPTSKPRAAGQQAKDTFLACQPDGFAGDGPFAGAAFLLWEAVCVLSAGVGGIAGAARAEGAADVRSMTATLYDALTGTFVTDELAAEIERAAERVAPGRLLVSTPSVEQADTVGLADTELRVELSRLVLSGESKPNQPVRFIIVLDVVLTDTASGESLRRASISVASEKRHLREWAADGGGYIVEAVGRAFPRLSEDVADFAFMLYPFPYRGLPHGSTWFTGLQAEYPRRSPGLFDFDKVPRANSIQPTFRWERFPRNVDVASDPETMQRVTNVTYDLAIAEEQHGGAGAVVYRRTGIPSNKYALETALEPSRRYYWTVRARFDLDGKQYVTEWAQYLGPRVAAPSHLNYLFKTPGERESNQQ